MTKCAILSAWLALCQLPAAEAHHSGAPHYDLAREISVTGVVNKFEFVNPHAYVYFMVLDADGKQAQWRCELAASATLSRLGWSTNSFSIGQKLTFKGAPARREEHVCVLNSFVREDGVQVSSSANLLTGNLGRSGRGSVSLTSGGSAQPASTGTSGGVPLLAGYWVSADDGPGAARGRRGGGGERGGPPERGGRGEEPPGGRAGGGGRGRGGGMPQPTAAGIAAAGNYDQRFDDPALKCSVGNILFGWTHDQNVNEILQTPTTLTLKYGYMDFTRTIHLDQAQHPSNLKASVGGHSIGRWEQGVLVVDTVGFLPGVLSPLGGVLHSAQLHVIERFSLDASGNTLTRDYTVADPLYLQQSYGGSDRMGRSAESPRAYNCTELSGRNNQRPAS